MSRARQFFMILCAAASLILAPLPAQAAEEGPLSCTATGGVAGGRLYTYYSTVPAQGPVCQYTGFSHIFSQVICEFVLILNEVMGKLYCGIQFAITSTLSIVLTLYVVVFGAQMLMGTAQLNAREFMFRMLKIAAVWALCTQSAWGIGFMFNFFLSFIASAGTWVVNGLMLEPDAGGGLVYSEMGNTLKNMGMTVATVDGNPPIFGFFDTLVWRTLTGTLAASDNRIIGFFMALLVVFTPLYFIVLWWIWTTVLTMIKAVISFLMALAAIAFLITLCPLFLSFMLFESTRSMFERWLSYMVSYALQVVLVFGIIVFWLVIMTRFVDFYNELAALIFPYNRALLVAGAVYDPSDNWGICPYTYREDNGVPHVTCVDATRNPPFNSDPSNPAINTEVVTAEFPGGAPQWRLDMQQVILPSAIPGQANFVYYLFYHIITLVLVSYAFSELLKEAHSIARGLSGASPPALVPAGWGSGGGGGRTHEAGTLRSGEASRLMSPPVGQRNQPG